MATMVGTAGNDLILGSAGTASFAARRVADGLDSPVFVTAPPGDSGRLFIVERDGAIRILDRGMVVDEPFLDLTGEVSTGGERGLLGLAFHPDFATSGRFTVNMTNLAGDTEIRTYQVSAADPNRADPGSASLVLAVAQPFANHNGGWLGFAGDGSLFVALGDGGGSHDPQGNAQNPDSLLGKMLRLDLSADAFPDDALRNYAIPADNPFVGQAGADEVWALGLRNPWRASFDRATGALYIADVGQDDWEEVDLGVAGGNYGWSVFEGPLRLTDASLPQAIAPIAAYDHSQGQSITGGYVYRGPAGELQGHYVFADFLSARLWTMDTATLAVTERTVTADAGGIDLPVSFGEGAAGELYLVDFDGEVFELTPQAADAADQIFGAGGGDTLIGGGENDILLGGDLDDTLFGNTGIDQLFGNAGFDVLHGGKDDDRLLGGKDDDQLFGDLGDDALSGDLGSDTLTGGAGNDQFWYTDLAQDGDVITDFTRGEDVLVFEDSVFVGNAIGFSDGTLFYDQTVLAVLPGVGLLTSGDIVMV